MSRWKPIVVLLAAGVCTACGDGPAPPPPPPCDEACRDGVALKGMRETMKLVFNLTLQGKPVGTYDVPIDCIEGGSARISGTATSNAVQGATDVDLTYVFDRCGYLQKDDDADDSYSLTLTGTVTQRGTLAVQPSATTALVMKGTLSITGTVYDPPEAYDAIDCPVDVLQNGNRLGGRICTREAGADL